MIGQHYKWWKPLEFPFRIVKNFLHLFDDSQTLSFKLKQNFKSNQLEFESLNSSPNDQAVVVFSSAE